VAELLIDLYVRQRRLAEALDLSSAWFARPACATDERRLCRVERQAALLRAVGREDEAETWEERLRELRGTIARRGYERERLGDGAPETPAVTSCGATWLTGPVFPSPLL
jgi:hypothetical protein